MTRMPEKWWEDPMYASALGAMPVQSAGYTGAGPDGALQANRRVPGAGNGQYDAHEGEFVFDANTTAAIGPDVLQSMQQGIQSGRVDANMIRTAIGQPPKQGFQAGGFTGTEEVVDTSKADVQQEALDFQAGVMRGDNPVMDTIQRNAVTRTGLTGAAANTALKQEAASAGMGALGTRSLQAAANADTSSRVADLQGKLAIQRFQDANTAAQSVFSNSQTMKTTAEGTRRWQAEFDTEQASKKNTEAWTNFERIAEYGDDAAVAAAWQAATGRELPADASINDIRTYAKTKRAQDVTKGEQSIQQGDIAIQAGLQGLTMGGLQIAAQQIANSASQYGLDQTKFRDALDYVSKYGFDDADGLYRSTGVRFTPEQIRALKRDYTYEGQIQDLTIQDLQGKLQEADWQALQTRIDGGASLAQVNQWLAAKGQKPLTNDQYLGMLEATPLGERNWGRNLAMAATLAAMPGEANKTEAAGIYKTMFPGVDMDFTQILAGEKSAQFTEGMANLASFSEMDMEWTDVLSVMKKDGTIEMLGVDEAQAETLFRGLKVNAIDEAWKTIEESDAYASITDPMVKAGIKSVFEQSVFGTDDFKADYVYTVKVPAEGTAQVIQTPGKQQPYDPVWTTKEFVGEAAAQEYAKGKTGAVVTKTDQVKAEITVPGSTGGSATGTWENFSVSQGAIPQDRQVSYDDWVKAGKPATFEAYQDASPSTLEAGVKTVAEESKTWGVLPDVISYSDKWYQATFQKEGIEKTRSTFQTTPEKAATATKAELFNLIKTGGASMETPVILSGDSSTAYAIGSVINEGKSVVLVSLKDGSTKRLNNY